MRRSGGILILTVAIALPALAACTGPILGVRGSGRVTSESRDVSGFDDVVLRGSGNVLIEIGDTESLEIEAEDNLLQYLTSEVDGGRLILEASQSIAPTEHITYTITMTELAGASISGSGDITADAVDGASLEIEVSGSGSFSGDGVTVDMLTANVSGSGEISLSGTADRIDVGISGSGDFDGADLMSVDGEVTVSGSGDATVNVSDRLTATVTGSGDIRYLGNPSVDATTSGSGDIGPG